MRTSGDDIPERAIVAGKSSDGGNLFVGKAHCEGGLFPGKVNPDHECCYISYYKEGHMKQCSQCPLAWFEIYESQSESKNNCLTIDILNVEYMYIECRIYVHWI